MYIAPIMENTPKLHANSAANHTPKQYGHVTSLSKNLQIGRWPNNSLQYSKIVSWPLEFAL